MEQETKKCSKCGRELPLDEFALSKKSPDGRQYACRQCKKEYNKKRNEERKRAKSNINQELAKFKTTELIDELRDRGLSGDLEWRKKVKV